MLWENFLCMCSVQCTVLMMRFASCLLSRAEMSTIWSMHWVHYGILFVHFRDILRTTVTTAECPQLFNFIATFNNWINGWFETQYCSVRCWCPLTVTCHVLTVMRNAPRDASRAGHTTFISIVMPNSSPAHDVRPSTPVPVTHFKLRLSWIPHSYSHNLVTKGSHPKTSLKSLSVRKLHDLSCPYLSLVCLMFA